MRKNTTIFWISTIFLALLFTSYAGATVIGSSSISIASANTSLYQGKSVSIPYVVKLASGSTWGTTLNVVDLSYLNSMGIHVSLSQSYAEPTYTGNMSITTSNNTIPGNYNITLNATGDDPSQSNAVLKLTVLKPSNTISTPTSTISKTNSTTPPSVPTLPTTPSSVSYPTTPSFGVSTYIYIIAIIIIVIVIAALVLAKRH